MNSPTIHFTETMRGQGVLTKRTQQQEAARPAGVSPAEDSAFVRQQTEDGLQQGQGFTMAWRDLAVAVVTKGKSRNDGLSGTIEGGQIQVDGLDAQPLQLTQGTFELLPEVGPGQRRMRYQLRCCTSDGQRRYILYGFKQVELQEGAWRLWGLWQDTTTLYVTIYEDAAGQADRAMATGIVPLPDNATLVGTGIIRIHPLDFAHQLLTFRSTGVDGAWAQIGNFWRFIRFFSGSLVTIYFGSRRVIAARHAAKV